MTELQVELQAEARALGTEGSDNGFWAQFGHKLEVQENIVQLNKEYKT